MSALDLDALEAKARAATPGPWTHDQRSMVCVGSDGIADDCRWDDAAFIAACDPTTVLALITRLRAAEARTAWQPIETAPRDCCVIGWADEWARPDVAWYCAGAWWSGCGSPCPEITHWQPLPAAPEAP